MHVDPDTCRRPRLHHQHDTVQLCRCKTGGRYQGAAERPGLLLGCRTPRWPYWPQVHGGDIGAGAASGKNPLMLQIKKQTAGFQATGACTPPIGLDVGTVLHVLLWAPSCLLLLPSPDCLNSTRCMHLIQRPGSHSDPQSQIFSYCNCVML